MSLFNVAKKQDPSVRDMIDRYLASGGRVQPIPSTDSRIKPLKRVMDWDSLSPNADAGTVIRATRERRAPVPRAYDNWPPMEAVITKVGECQSAPGSSRAQRFEILTVGATLGQMREKGLRLSDLTRYLGSGTLELQIADGGGAAVEVPPAQTPLEESAEGPVEHEEFQGI